MEKYFTKRNIIIASILGLLVVLFGWNDVINLRAEEPRRAIVGIEMFLSGEYIAPHINGWAYYNKPPIFNWLLVFFYWIFNSFEEWVVRIPSILSFLLIGLISYRINKQFFSKKVAFFSSLFFLTSADILFFGSINAGEIDLFFSLTVYLQTIAIFYYYNKGAYFKMFLYSYIFAAIGTLTKGPPSIAFQGLTLLGWLLYNKEFKLLFSLKHIVSGLFFLGIVVGYFMIYNLNNDGVGFAVRLFKEASMRTGAEHSFSDTLVGAATFPFYLGKLLLPWSLFVIFWFRKDFISLIKKNQLLLFSSIFIVANIILYWFTPDHKARYLYMFLPYFCLLLAYFFVHQKENWKKASSFFYYLFLVAMVIATIGFIASIFIPQLKAIESLYLKSSILIILSLFVLFLYVKFKRTQAYSFLLFIITCRLAINFFYLPMVNLHQNIDYNKTVKEMLSITNGDMIYWYGKNPYTFKSDASIGPLKMKEVSISSAPLLAYQIPYYLSKETNQIMQFDTILKPNTFYLTPAQEIDTNQYKIYYSFEDKWQQKQLVLIKSK